MTSSYLIRIRSPHEVIAALIANREAELPHVRDAVERRNIQEAITFLRSELARIADDPS